MTNSARGNRWVLASSMIMLALSLSTAAYCKESSNLDRDQVWNANYCIDHHAVKLKDCDCVQGATRVETVDKDEDNLRWWSIAMLPASNTTMYRDFNGDGNGDAAMLVKCNDRVHLITVLNRNGRPMQTGDLLVTTKYVCTNELKFAGGLLDVNWLDYEVNKTFSCKFKFVGDKFVLVSSPPDAKGMKIEELSLTTNPHDVANPQIPMRIPETLATDSTATGLSVKKLTKAVLKQGLLKVKKKFDLVDEYNGFGTIENIAFGDLNGDGKEDAAVIFGISRASNTQLVLIPAVVDHGKLNFVGRVDIGAGGFDTSDKKVEIKSGVIDASVKLFDRENRSKVFPWFPMRYKIIQGNKLIKLK